MDDNHIVVVRLAGFLAKHRDQQFPLEKLAEHLDVKLMDLITVVAKYSCMFQNAKVDGQVGVCLNAWPKICFSAGFAGKTTDCVACDGLHLCTGFLLGTCNDSSKCSSNHAFQSELEPSSSVVDSFTDAAKNQKILERLGLADWPADVLLSLVNTIEVNLPLPSNVCAHYNNSKDGACPMGLECQDYHCCVVFFLMGTCQGQPACKKSHGIMLQEETYAEVVAKIGSRNSDAILNQRETFHARVMFRKLLSTSRFAVVDSPPPSLALPGAGCDRMAVKSILQTPQGHKRSSSGDVSPMSGHSFVKPSGHEKDNSHEPTASPVTVEGGSNKKDKDEVMPVEGNFPGMDVDDGHVDGPEKEKALDDEELEKIRQADNVEASSTHGMLVDLKSSGGMPENPWHLKTNAGGVPDDRGKKGRDELATASPGLLSDNDNKNYDLLLSVGENNALERIDTVNQSHSSHSSVAPGGSGPSTTAAGVICDGGVEDAGISTFPGNAAQQLRNILKTAVNPVSQDNSKHDQASHEEPCWICASLHLPGGTTYLENLFLAIGKGPDNPDDAMLQDVFQLPRFVYDVVRARLQAVDRNAPGPSGSDARVSQAVRTLLRILKNLLQNYDVFSGQISPLMATRGPEQSADPTLGSEEMHQILLLTAVALTSCVKCSCSTWDIRENWRKLEELMWRLGAYAAFCQQQGIVPSFCWDKSKFLQMLPILSVPAFPGFVMGTVFPAASLPSSVMAGHVLLRLWDTASVPPPTLYPMSKFGKDAFDARNVKVMHGLTHVQIFSVLYTIGREVRPVSVNFQQLQEGMAWFYKDGEEWKLLTGTFNKMTFGLSASFMIDAAVVAHPEAVIFKLESFGLTGCTVYPLLKRMISPDGKTWEIEKKEVNMEPGAGHHWLPMIKDGPHFAEAILVPMPVAHFRAKCGTQIPEEAQDDAGFLLRVNIVQVWRIQNPQCFQRFKQRHQELQDVYSKDDADAHTIVMSLFHGTSANALAGICHEGFDPTRAGENGGTAWGCGTYFGKKFEQSHIYACEALPTPTSADRVGTRRFMFVCSVVVGQVTQGSPGLTSLPWKGKIQFDTAVDNVLTPTVFVKFDGAQSYPHFLMEYEVHQTRPNNRVVAGCCWPCTVGLLES